MEERKWILGDDLAACDNLLDGITFDDVILAVHCNCRVISRRPSRSSSLKSSNSGSWT